MSGTDRATVLRVLVIVGVLGFWGSPAASAQQPPVEDESTQQATPPADSRAGEIAARQAEKAKKLTPPTVNRVEKAVNNFEERYLTGQVAFHPWFTSAYSGGGFTLGAGYAKHVSSYNTCRRSRQLHDQELQAYRSGIPGAAAVRPSRLALGDRAAGARPRRSRSTASAPATRRRTTAPTSVSSSRICRRCSSTGRRARYFLLGAGLEFAKWDTGPGSGSAPSVDEVYTPSTLPGLNASPTYVHPQGTIAFDWRPAKGYARTGGYYGVTIHSFMDRDDFFSFRQYDYEVIQHVPVLRDTWVLSFHGRVQTTDVDDDQEIPFFMMPALGGGSSLRGFSSWRFRDRHSLLLQAEWRILLNNFLDMAVFYDAGKVTARRSDLDLDGLKSDYGIGFRLHGPMLTPLRLELAKSNEQLHFVFSAKAAF